MIKTADIEIAGEHSRAAQSDAIFREAADGAETGEPARAAVRRNRVIDEPRAFEIDELFFSTTDRKGLIQSGNEVFKRVSGFSWSELKNTAHSIIRHPDMPRCVFQVLWDTIGAGEALVAYVKNRAKDGRYYWVVALVLPIPEGYLSVRFKPSSPLFSVAQQLYGELRKAEVAAEERGEGKKNAIAISSELLTSRLAEMGFKSYPEFMRRLLQEELQSRDAALAGCSMESAGCGGAAPAGSALVNACGGAFGILRRLFADLDSYVTMTQSIREKERSALLLSDTVRYLSLNAALEATRLGRSGEALSPIFDWLSVASRDTTKSSQSLSQQLTDLTRQTELAIYNLGAARLQIEMIYFFAREMSRLGEGDSESEIRQADEASIRILIQAFDRIAGEARESIAGVRAHLAELRVAQDRVAISTRTLRFTYVAGKVEVARLADRERLEKMFLQLGERLHNSEAEMKHLKDTVGQLDDVLDAALRQCHYLQGAVRQMDEASTG